MLMQCGKIVWLKMDLHDEHETHDTFSCCERKKKKSSSIKLQMTMTMTVNVRRENFHSFYLHSDASFMVRKAYVIHSNSVKSFYIYIFLQPSYSYWMGNDEEDI
ncbi:hypothetical protein ACKWTF_001430 [Chironomus riparius]